MFLGSIKETGAGMGFPMPAVASAAIYFYLRGILVMKKLLNDTNVLSLNTKNPKIYVVCEATYQAGNIHGIWIDVTKSIQDILKQIAIMQYDCHRIDKMLSDDYFPNPSTYAIQCHFGFYNVEIQRNAKIEDVRAYAIFIEKHGEIGAELIAYFGGDLEKAKKLMDERYLGEYWSKAEYVDKFFNKNYLPKISKDKQFCINYDYLKEIIFTQYCFSIETNGKAHVFFGWPLDSVLKEQSEDILKYFVINLTPDN